MKRKNFTQVNIWPGFVDAMTTLLLVFIFLLSPTEAPEIPNQPVSETVIQVEPDSGTDDDTESLEEELEVEPEEAGPTEVIGKSVNGSDITVYNYGKGDTEVLFIGGIHGGYSFNTALVAQEIMNYLDKSPDVIPDNVKVAVIPVANPDGLSTVVRNTDSFSASEVTAEDNVLKTARFNANGVDLNRNFACQWKPEGVWQSQTVSGGDEPFSEPESRAIRDYIERQRPAAVIAYYSAAGGVYASNCQNGVSAETTTLTDLYAKAADYTASEDFDFYAITGDMVNWVAKQEIPAISVLLTDRKNTEWNKNKAGVNAILQYYAD